MLLLCKTAMLLLGEPSVFVFFHITEIPPPLNHSLKSAHCPVWTTCHITEDISTEHKITRNYVVNALPGEQQLN